jgi:hypothetical protein
LGIWITNWASQSRGNPRGHKKSAGSPIKGLVKRKNTPLAKKITFF